MVTCKMKVLFVKDFSFRLGKSFWRANLKEVRDRVILAFSIGLSNPISNVGGRRAVCGILVNLQGSTVVLGFEPGLPPSASYL
jgi:hypothetical protein